MKTERHHGVVLGLVFLGTLALMVSGLTLVPLARADNLPQEILGEQENKPIPELEPEPVLVNKSERLPADYAPSNLRPVKIPFSFSGDSPKRMLRSEAADALERLFDLAKENGIELVGVSGFRSYERQATIFTANAQRYGEEMANRVSARPGESEHQTGLAMDVSSPSVNYELTESFGRTKEGKWLAENAPEFGFIIRYPAGTESVTGYQYEPWHLRYVGELHASRIAQQSVTLEEYLEGLA